MRIQKTLRLGLLLLFAAALAFSMAVTQGTEVAKADDGCCNIQSCMLLCGAPGWERGSREGGKCVHAATACDEWCACP